MLNNKQKSEFVETIFERIPVDAKSEDARKEIMSLLMADTQNGKMYKYRAINEYAISNLKEGTLYCAVPSSFNDPFDCKLGMDIQSAITTRFEQELDPIEDYFVKFLQVIDGTVLIEDCTYREKEIFERWFESQKFCSFIDEYRGSDISDDKLKEVLVENIDMIIELMIGLSEDDELRSQMESANVMFKKLLYDMTPEQRMQVINDKSTLADFAKNFGVCDDVDEISLVMRLHQLQKPEQYEMTIKLDDELAEATQKLAEDIDNKYRVGSLCTDYKNRLMWSHYADGHKGFCIEYDFSVPYNEADDILILPVIYSKERIKFPWSVVFAVDKESEKVKLEAAYTMLLSLLTKDEVWSYENEWRVIALCASGIENIKMPPISCIYIGAMCDSENKALLMEIGKEINVPVKQMVVDRGEYTLHAKELGKVD